MKTMNSSCMPDLIEERIAELERDLIGYDDFKMLNNTQCIAYQRLKNIVGEGNWLILDEYVCLKNAEYEYAINYFYNKGFSDGISFFCNNSKIC